MTTPNACPACGSNRLRLEEGSWLCPTTRIRFKMWFYQCEKCGKSGPTAFDMEEATRLWNEMAAEEYHP